MSIRKDMQDLMKTEIQRFKEEPLTQEEQDKIDEDTTTFCVYMLREILGEEFIKRKGAEVAKRQATFKAMMAIKEDKKNNE
jgi:hypothetical protein